MKIASIKAACCKPAMNKIQQTFKGESPGGYSYDDWGESPCGGGSYSYSSYSGESPSSGRCSSCGESPSVGRSSSSRGGESPGYGCSSSSSSRRSGRRRRGESPSFGHKVNASYAINNPEKVLQTKLDFLKIQQLERAKKVSKDKM